MRYNGGTSDPKTFQVRFVAAHDLFDPLAILMSIAHAVDSSENEKDSHRHALPIPLPGFRNGIQNLFLGKVLKMTAVQHNYYNEPFSSP